MICPLCSSSEVTLFDQDGKRSFHRCSVCELVFVPRSEILSEQDEKKRYEAHENSSQDAGYVKYLNSIYQNIHPHIGPEFHGLDFGCGKTTVLADFFGNCDSYDVFFRPDEEIWTKTYDYIILSEVIEHLTQPIETMEKLRSLLKPGGQFFIKTQFIPENFSTWFYKRDLTHVQFFNPVSMNWLGNKLGMNDFRTLVKDLYHFTMS